MNSVKVHGSCRSCSSFSFSLLFHRSSRKREDVDDVVLTDDEVAIMIQVDDDPRKNWLLLPISGPIEVEMEELTLADELEAKSNAGEKCSLESAHEAKARSGNC